MKLNRNSASRTRPLACVALGVMVGAAIMGGGVGTAHAKTPGYPEQVIQWTVQDGETCGDIALALYGKAHLIYLVERYSGIDCRGGSLVLKTGETLVVPAKNTSPPAATLRAMKPAVRAKPPGGGWSPAAPGMPLHRRYSVNTRDDARADVRFIDRTRIYLAENTLVIIYGTAGRSAIAKSKPVVQLDSGEVQAGLAALRGKPVRVDVAGGGNVAAQSKDTVLRKKEKRTTVSVFDGDAEISSAGKKVTVPKHYGSSFESRRAPEKPKPLPPPPSWLAATSRGVVLAPPGEGLIVASWGASKRAETYRVEVATSADFADLVVREEVPANVTSFRAEKMPAGTYYLRVRSIDAEDFLGIASATRQVQLVEAEIESGPGRLEPGIIETTRYGSLSLDPSSGVQLAVDQGPFGPVPKSLDISLKNPEKLRFRVHGGQETSYQVKYRELEPDISVKAAEEQLTVAVRFNASADLVKARVRPRARLRGAKSAGAAVPLELQGGQFAAALPRPDDDEGLQIDILDGRGRLLGSSPVADEPTPDSPRSGPERPRLGPAAPPAAPSPITGISPWSTHAPDAAYLEVVGASSDGETLQGRARAVGTRGRFGFDLMLPSDGTSDSVPVSRTAWIGLRFEATSWDDGAGSFGPYARGGLTTVDGGANQGEGGVGLAWRKQRLTWLASLGGRARLGGGEEGVPDAQGFISAGAAYSLSDMVQVLALLDGHVLGQNSDVFGRGGLSLGLEIGDPFFVALGGRVSPFDELDTQLMGSLALGVRHF